MEQTTTQDLEAPRFEEFGPLLVAGLSESYADATSVGIPALWQCFVPHIGHIPGQMGATTYGALYNTAPAGNFDLYLLRRSGRFFAPS